MPIIFGILMEIAMDSITAIVYGIIQGISEFLPISSSAHLALLPYLFEVTDPGVLFDLTMHLGTALGALVCMRAYFVPLLRNPIKNPLLSNLAISTITTAVLVFLLKPWLEMGRQPILIATNLLVFGILMGVVDRKKIKKEFNPLTTYLPIHCLLIGLFQSLAIFPGVSRFGIIFTIAIFTGIKRHNTAHYSLLLSIPVIIGGFILELPTLIDLLGKKFELSHLIIGISISFVSSIVAIKFLLAIIDKWGLLPFAIYRVGLALILYSLLLL